MIKEDYEISLWKDVWVQEVDEALSHFEERKIGIIGSNYITASCRAFEPNLIENTDGTNKFTFKILINCRDDTYEDLRKQFMVQPSIIGSQSLEQFYTNDTQDGLPFLFDQIEFINNTYKNPFIPLLTNERKVKVFWKGKWYDLVIKNCQEDSEHQTITYTCADVFINELSKTGLDLVLDNELENNYGNVTTLAESVLEGTDWTVDLEKSETIQQTEEEALFKIHLNNSDPFEAINETQQETFVTIPSGEKDLYIFYNQILEIVNDATVNSSAGEVNFHNRKMQFIYNAVSSDDNTNVDDGNCYRVFVNYTIHFNQASGSQRNWEYIDVVIPPYDPGSDPVEFSIVIDNLIVKRGKRLVKTQQIVYDPLTKKYCSVYKALSNNEPLYSINDIIYSYVNTEFKDPLSVNNLLVNSKGFLGFDGWTGTGLKFKSWPEYDSDSDTSYHPKGYLKITDADYDGEIIPGITINQGLRYNSNYLSDGVAEGEQFVFRIRAFYGTENNPILNSPVNDPLSIVIIPQIRSNLNQGEQISYFAFSNWTVEEEQGAFKWLTATGTCQRSFTRADIYNNNIIFRLLNRGYITTGPGPLRVWLEEVQLYPLMMGVDENDNPVRINPGEINTALVTTVTYNYYNHTDSFGHILYPEDILYIARETVPYEEGSLYSNITPVCNDNFEKILTVNAKQSNRYNLLQTLAEKFECYIHFQIEHDIHTGALIYDQITKKPYKKVYFTRERGQQTGIGFVYGIDLKTIQRTIQSDQIVTKMIVQPNNNQFAENGFCTIARSKQNYSKANFILDFDYYYSQGLLDEENTSINIINYLSTIGFGTGWYNKYAQKVSEENNILLKQQSYVTLYEATINNITQQIENLWYEIFTLINAPDPGPDYRDDRIEAYENYINAHPDASEVTVRFYTIMNLEESLESYSEALYGLQDSISSLKRRIQSDIGARENILLYLNGVHKQFYSKYATFIQEGTWKDDNYINDDLYYIDSLKTAHEAAMPKVSYNISVIRVSALDEFKNKVFRLGDIAYIEDKEFFGYHYINGVKTPYREKVTISEISSFFEEPEKDTFKVQNYKTDFEDLFQRINYTSQEFAYSSGLYNRIGLISTSDGLIDSDILQDSISASKVPIHFGSDLITQDGNGITILDMSRANQQTRITSGGIFTTQDGGETWKNAVSAKGVSVEALAPGMLDLGKVSVADDTGKVKITKDGIQMKGTTSGEGINYKDGSIEGHFNNLYIETVADPSDPSKVDHLRVDNDEIEHYTCTGSACSYGGKISFGKSSGIALSPTNRSNTLLTLASDTITLDAENGMFMFATEDSENHLISLSIDLKGGKMIYTWWESSGTEPSEHTSVLNLKTFTP